MKKIQVVGMGCPTCKKLYELTKQVATGLGLKNEIEYITDVNKIMEMGITQTPVLAIDGNPILIGFSPDIEKVKQLLSDNLKDE